MPNKQKGAPFFYALTPVGVMSHIHSSSLATPIGAAKINYIITSTK